MYCTQLQHVQSVQHNFSIAHIAPIHLVLFYKEKGSKKECAYAVISISGLVHLHLELFINKTFKTNTTELSKMSGSKLL